MSAELAAVADGLFDARRDSRLVAVLGARDYFPASSVSAKQQVLFITVDAVPHDREGICEASGTPERVLSGDACVRVSPSHRRLKRSLGARRTGLARMVAHPIDRLDARDARSWCAGGHRHQTCQRDDESCEPTHWETNSHLDPPRSFGWMRRGRGWRENTACGGRSATFDIRDESGPRRRSPVRVPSLPLTSASTVQAVQLRRTKQLVRSAGGSASGCLRERSEQKRPITPNADATPLSRSVETHAHRRYRDCRKERLKLRNMAECVTI